MSSDSKVALITGSTSGIGLACAHVLAKRGVNVIVSGSRDASLVGDTLEELRRHRVRVDYVSADLSKVPNVEALWAEVLRLYPDGVDILINNAGVQHRCLVEEYAAEKWDQLIAINLTAPFHLTKNCLPFMKKKKWGRIINMSSMAGVVAYAGSAVYATTKHGIIGFTKGVSAENAQYGITCNAVCPAYVRTPMFDTLCEFKANVGGTSVEQAEAAILASISTGKVITSEQVAELVEFLCLSSASSQMTGASYLIDHGFTAS